MRWWRRGGVGAAGVKDRGAVPVQVRERCGEADRLGPFAGRMWARTVAALLLAVLTSERTLCSVAPTRESWRRRSFRTICSRFSRPAGRAEVS